MPGELGSPFFGVEFISCCSNLLWRLIVDKTPLKLAVFFFALPFGVLSPILRTGNLGDDISSIKSKSDFSSGLWYQYKKNQLDSILFDTTDKRFLIFICSPQYLFMFIL